MAPSQQTPPPSPPPAALITFDYDFPSAREIWKTLRDPHLSSLFTGSLPLLTRRRSLLLIRRTRRPRRFPPSHPSNQPASILYTHPPTHTHARAHTRKKNTTPSELNIIGQRFKITASPRGEFFDFFFFLFIINFFLVSLAAAN